MGMLANANVIGGGGKALYCLEFDGFNDQIIIPFTNDYISNYLEISFTAELLGTDPGYTGIISKGSSGVKDFVLVKDAGGLERPLAIHAFDTNATHILPTLLMPTTLTNGLKMIKYKLIFDFINQVFNYFENNILLFSYPITGTGLDTTATKITMFSYSDNDQYTAGKLLDYTVNGVRLDDSNSWAGCVINGATRKVSFDNGKTWQIA